MARVSSWARDSRTGRPAMSCWTHGEYPEWVRSAVAGNPEWVEARLTRNPQWINEQLKQMSVQGDLFA